jgi:hypothetical protein
MKSSAPDSGNGRRTRSSGTTKEAAELIAIAAVVATGENISAPLRETAADEA